MIGFIDGLALTTECTSEAINLNAIYNGYHSDKVFNNIFAYVTKRKVFLCIFNFPGIGHDYSITANILPFIKRSIGNHKMCVDQGFPMSAM
jgi:hypothetical protein